MRLKSTASHPGNGSLTAKSQLRTLYLPKKSSWGHIGVFRLVRPKTAHEKYNSDKVPPPPGVAVAARRMLKDVNNEPQYGERVPYVITRGEPGMKLVDRAVAPEELFHSGYVLFSILKFVKSTKLSCLSKHIDAMYYISRVLIPPLERIFNLMGADVRSWYDAMMKSVLADNPDAVLASPEKDKSEDELRVEVEGYEKAAIDTYYRSNQCMLCGASTNQGLASITEDGILKC